MKKLFVLFSVFLITSCGTPYQERGLRGGVTGIRLDDTIFEVSSSGNSFTDRSTVYRYNLRKAAEMSLAAGCKYFVAIGNKTQHFNVGVTGANNISEGLSVVNGNMVYQINNVTYTVIKPNARFNTYACFNKKPNAVIPGLVFNAKYTLEDVTNIKFDN